MHEGFWAWLLADKGQLAVAGALGGVVRWLSLREDWRDGLVSITVGAICAVYLSPLAIPLFDSVLGKIVVDAAARHSFSGFLIGIGGIAVSGLVLDVWKARRRQVSTDTLPPSAKQDKAND
jgi:hypothetical protein